METPPNKIEKIERKIITGYDFARTLRVQEILKEIGEDPSIDFPHLT